MKKVVAVLSGLVVLAVVVQFFLAASGAFDNAPREESFGPHRALGTAILALAVVVTIAAALARLPGRIIGMWGLTVGLLLLQMVITEVAGAIGDGSTAAQLVFGLHAVNGLAIMGLATFLLWRSRQISRKPIEPNRMAS
ncbi:DUF6220 domain-containing protein [Amycolatopsis taiwanensis]|uniref:DUF6220 domain-containing protein n=1 Tax=Amycolatopsis taiwanensis TaxID=342230 RepID=UPI0004B13A9D|nr:DUF6220 domain-containing protein [Amycolatopsis taiwanensis]